MLQFEVDVQASSQESRTIEGIAVPFGKTAELNGSTYSFKKGSLSKGRAITPLLLDHSTEKPVGVLVDLSDGDEGAMATFKIDQTPEGDAALATAASGSRGGLSVGVNLLDFDEVEGVSHVRAASLMEVSLVAIPAFADAAVTTVTASEDSPAKRDESATTESAKEVEMDAPTPEVVEEKVEVVVQASAPAPAVTLSVDEYVHASLAAQRGDHKAAEVIAALDLTITDDVYGLIPDTFQTEIVDKTSNPRTLYSAMSKRALPADSKRIVTPRDDRVDYVDGWRSWDSDAPTQKYTVGTKSIEISPWSTATAYHIDTQNRSQADVVSMIYAKHMDSYNGAVEVAIAAAIDSAAQAATGFEEAVETVYENGLPFGVAPNLILATPAFHSYLLGKEGHLMYSTGNAAAKPYSGNVAGLPLVVSPLLSTNYVVNSGAYTWMESPTFRLSAAQVSALSIDLATTRYAASYFSYVPADMTDPANPVYDDDASLAIASFPTPTP